MNTTGVISKDDLLKNWQDHRAVTRRTIERFPAQELFEFSIGGMRTYAAMIQELISIAVPSLTGIVNDKMDPLNHNLNLNTKEELLAQWDADTSAINDLYKQISIARFQEKFAVYGDLKLPIFQNIQYFIDNEIHHRGQGYVYLRALGIEPPFFWERS